jgi:hypothetical protein
MPERNPVAFAAGGLVPIHELVCVNELAQNPDCQIARRRKKQKRWRERHPDYFIARRILDRGKADRPPDYACHPG